MLIGLDIAHLRLVDRILLFSLDTDLIPAIKATRVNSIQIIIPSYQDTNNPHLDIQEHADFIRNESIIDVINKLS
ncbi:hypothetical protein [Persephonella sp.]